MAECNCEFEKNVWYQICDMRTGLYVQVCEMNLSNIKSHKRDRYIYQAIMFYVKYARFTLNTGRRSCFGKKRLCYSIWHDLATFWQPSKVKQNSE